MVIFTLLLGLLPSFAWLWFFLKEDVHPEPKKIIAKVFFIGALATLPAIFIQLPLQEILKSFPAKIADPISFLIFGAIEEIFKFLAAYLAVRKSPYFDEPIDAMIYMITAALGFAMVENLAIAFSALTFQEAVSTITIRFVGATLLHALSSGVVGYYWAKGSIQRDKIMIVKGIVFASLLHMIFNYLILISQEKILIYPTIFLIIIALLIFWDFEKIKKVYG